MGLQILLKPSDADHCPVLVDATHKYHYKETIPVKILD